MKKKVDKKPKAKKPKTKPKTKQQMVVVLESAARKYTLVISEYLRFELYRGLARERVPSAKALVDSFTAFPVDKYTLDIAAALTTCYERDA